MTAASSSVAFYTQAPGDAEACGLAAIKQEFRQTSNLRELLLNLASSDSALFIEEAP